MKSQEKHLLFISIPAYGHIIPLLELARKVSKFHQVTFAVSARTVGDLPKRELFDATVDTRIKMYPIPDGIETAMEDPNDHELFKTMMPMMFGGIVKMVELIPISSEPSSVSELGEFTRPVDGVVSDNFLGPAARTCIERKIPLYLFNACPVSLTWLILSVHPDMKTAPKQELDGFVEMPDEHGNFKKPMPKEFLDDFMLPVQKILPKCHAVIVNSVLELESEGIKRCQSKPGMKDMPFFCIGPVLPEPKQGSNANAVVEQKVTKWLDTKDPGSVVYISFGSATMPNKDQVAAIAEAIKQLDQPVIWSLKAKSQQYLPEELKRATNMDNPNSKVLILTWAPQKKILSHESVGVFVSHCGWNSTMEGLSGGKPIVGWPQFAEQNLNGEFVAENNAGDVIRDAGSHKGSRVVSSQEIVDIIKKVQENNVEGARKFGLKLQAALQPNGSSTKEFEKMIAFIGSS
ncbi:hypothetical protein RvY_10536 [Ramazzottius varieornatus]|uniref:UDP-glucuronosyltransferase n=1 Tax=Ramazzottius varieornatus TaxID=947166 RepID=A0A1D1VF61_RAMVA|nr:hypothetical protein RvY_10536 [Ramazzottius varieornatus]